MLGVRYDDAEMKVVASVEQEDVLADLATLHAWYTEGLINADAATYPESNKYNVCSVGAGLALCGNLHLGSQSWA